MKGKIFNAQEVQAILNGSKVMFREVIKNQTPPDFVCDMKPSLYHSNNRFFLTGQSYDWWFEKCPYQVGQKIFCKESFFEDLIYRKFVGYEIENNLSETIKINARYMKQEHSRLTLLIKEIKVERLRGISEEDAIKEGATSRPKCFGYEKGWNGWSMDWSKVGEPSKYSRTGALSESDICMGSAEYAFGNHWNATHKKPEEKFEASPFVWKIEFEVVK